MTAAARASWFQRLVLPGFAFKAVVIGGGYATGREIAEFFLPAGPWGGLVGLALGTAIWSGVATLTFLFARATGARDYRAFFGALLGRGWVVFEAAYALFIVLVLAVFGAAAGEIGHATLAVPRLAGTLALMAAIAAVVAFGTSSVERLFAWVSVLLYGVYILFFAFALLAFGDRLGAAFAGPATVAPGWVAGGVTYAGYNIVGAVIILPVLRHLRSDRDAVIAGLAAGPLAMIPALLFFACMTAFMPAIAGEALPSDYLLARLGHPWFRYLFQLMIFAALLESGTGAVHAIMERVSNASARRGRALTRGQRGFGALVLLAICMLIAQRVGLVALIAGGYRLLAWVILAVYVLPLATLGVWRLLHRPAPVLEAA
ncbi:hypothetical protein [Sphingomonas sp. CROZ-RG-20F-R02-07]|uniref:YkvI family membrane protein n=1 Tax=Sphingomonas sp. CROZ-RG-20F-R02-07 TaxID=2914832 RepID=UPI001F59197F|nr:hypothetical protein [Sphingomonas sp. CROZ-RG-20F-R02-07]